VFSHSRNLYSDYTYYFLTTGTVAGLRIQPEASLDSTPNYYCRRFIDRAFHDNDSINLIKSGKTWVGEIFDNKEQVFEIPFSFPDIDTSSILRLVTNVIAKSPVVSKFILSVNGQTRDSITVDSTDPALDNIYARNKKKITNIFSPPSSGEISLEYNLPTVNSLGWLDYIEMTCQRNLIFTGHQMTFRDPNTIGDNKITQFIIQGTNPGLKIWDLTSVGSIREILPLITDTSMKFTCITDSLKEFIVFDTTGYYSVQLIGPVPCQNLHELQPATLVIITHPGFMDEAERLAEFHRVHDQMSVMIVKTVDIYNEFGCGQKDPAALRDFMKMLYDRGTSGNEPKYLLLFGDGSYDPKDRLPGNNNLIPAFQSVEYLKPLGTYVTDDFYGVMRDNEGNEANGSIEIGVGRFPVSTDEEAKLVVDKIIHYTSCTDTTLADWRNTITFVADDENDNMHMDQAEKLAQIVKSKYPVFNVNKIYLDAYKMVKTPAGYRLPEVNGAINKAVNSGTLILNYTGHGGEDGWSAEKVLTIADINKWTNYEKLPIFVTATCEFSRFDNPARVTAGEMVLLNPHGGAVALYSTSRLALATPNFKLDSSFMRNLIPEGGGPNPKMGDLVRISKNNNGNNGSLKNFVLLGDPVQNIAFPSWKISTTFINEKQVDSQPDTTLGLSRVTVKGQIEEASGVKLSNFNGTVFPTVYDKPVTCRTLGNTSDSHPQDFQVQNSILFKGQTPVRNGEFEFEFVVPKGISLQFGQGKISYYAQNGNSDANGYFDNIIIGGQDPSINPVNNGPEIVMYLDSSSFISGQRTGLNPTLYATLSDPDGINVYNLGIGHEIVATLDDDNSHAVVLNDLYQPAFDKYGSGTLQYQLTDLPNGLHSLRLKAWDLYDNSSSKEIMFLTFDQPLVSVNSLMNSPNPVSDHTVFSFKPMQGYGNLDVQIQIFTLSGLIVKTLKEKITEDSSSLITLAWDGTGENNQVLSNGLYIYRLTAQGSNGIFTTASQKLVISR
jgi:hypothetical protein